MSALNNFPTSGTLGAVTTSRQRDVCSGDLGMVTTDKAGKGRAPSGDGGKQCEP
jgi:hypothetical protein